MEVKKIWCCSFAGMLDEITESRFRSPQFMSLLEGNLSKIGFHIRDNSPSIVEEYGSIEAFSEHVNKELTKLMV